MPYTKRPLEDYVGLATEQRLENQRQQQIARINSEQRIAEASFIGASPNKAILFIKEEDLLLEVSIQGEWAFRQFDLWRAVKRLVEGEILGIRHDINVGRFEVDFAYEGMKKRIFITEHAVEDEIQRFIQPLYDERDLVPNPKIT